MVFISCCQLLLQTLFLSSALTLAWSVALWDSQCRGSTNCRDTFTIVYCSVIVSLCMVTLVTCSNIDKSWDSNPRPSEMLLPLSQQRARTIVWMPLLNSNWFSNGWTSLNFANRIVQSWLKSSPCILTLHPVDSARGLLPVEFASGFNACSHVH